MARIRLTKRKKAAKLRVRLKKKLTLLSPPNRKMVSFKLAPDTINQIQDFVTLSNSEFFNITKTDVIDAAIALFFEKSPERRRWALKRDLKSRAGRY